MHYSDQRDPLHGQKLAHQVSYDLQNWGPVVNDVAIAEYMARAGMTVIAYIRKCRPQSLACLYHRSNKITTSPHRKMDPRPRAPSRQLILIRLALPRLLRPRR